MHCCLSDQFLESYHSFCHVTLCLSSFLTIHRSFLSWLNCHVFQHQFVLDFLVSMHYVSLWWIQKYCCHYRLMCQCCEPGFKDFFYYTQPRVLLKQHNDRMTFHNHFMSYIIASWVCVWGSVKLTTTELLKAIQAVSRVWIMINQKKIHEQGLST